ncbi:hypothetical protein LguiA_012900 [Lonicera macranthoides]
MTVLLKDGVHHYIEKVLPAIKWGKPRRVVLYVGCGIASLYNVFCPKRRTCVNQDKEIGIRAEESTYFIEMLCITRRKS